MKPNKILDYEAEYYKIKKNNRSLAKALAEQQQLNKKYLDENILLQKKLYVSSSMNMHYERSLNQILISSKSSIESCINLSNNLSSTMSLCKQGTNIQTTLLENFIEDDKNSLNKVILRSTSPGNPHKTHAVKPMVSGHVIHSPTINLSRLSEIRTSGLPTVDTSVENHNSQSYDTVLNNHETINNDSDIRGLPTSRIPIRGLTPEAIDDTLTDDSLEDESIDFEHENIENRRRPVHVSNNRLSVRLEPLMEVNDEESRSPYNNIVKEVRIIIEPLPLENNNFITGDTNTPTVVKPGKSRGKRLHQYDPLEGTSTMLDNTGNLIGFNNYRFKPRQTSKRMCVEYESDSDENVDNNKKKSWVSKRKSPAEKKDITGRKYKIKRNSNNGNNSISDPLSPQTSHEENNTKTSFEEEWVSKRKSPTEKKIVTGQKNSNNGSNPINDPVSSQTMYEENNTNNSFDEIDVPFERRSRRLAPKSLVEPSLKKKLRR